MVIQHVWVLPIGFVLESWCDSLLKEVVNSIGSFVSLDGDPWLNPNKRMGNVLIKIELRRDLLVEIDVECGNYSFT